MLHRNNDIISPFSSRVVLYNLAEVKRKLTELCIHITFLDLYISGKFVTLKIMHQLLTCVKKITVEENLIIITVTDHKKKNLWKSILTVWHCRSAQVPLTWHCGKQQHWGCDCHCHSATLYTVVTLLQLFFVETVLDGRWGFCTVETKPGFSMT